ncbi:MAG: response regulator transcription factor [Chloroflexota bacterium]|nr:response regulator transcription factor [Chloroflexota bacterium]
MTDRILVVEDDGLLVKFLRATLAASGYSVDVAADGVAAMEALTSRPTDLVLLDLGLPHLDGIDILRQLRTWTDVPVLVLSARDQQQEKVQALDIGADDYLTKPFGVPELLARVRAALRRAARTSGGDGPRVAAGDLVIDLPAQRVERSGEAVHLTPTEWRVLRELVLARPRTVPHRLLLERVWGPGYGDEVHYVRVVIRRLRQKLEPDPDAPRYLLSEIGFGYRFEG